MAWEKVKLGDVSESCLGKMLDQQKNRGDFHPYLANVNVRWGSFDLNDLPLMKFEENEQERYGLKYGDLVICEGGEPGRCAIWKEQVPNMKIQKALHRVRVNSDMDYRYVFYWFLYAGKRGALDQYFTGATIKHMPGEKLKQVVIDKPPLKTQKRIADILSAYDDLIENNQKQVKLLEEAAQRLYKQWFIDLKFPGHETTKIVDGLPEGWKKEKFGDVVDYIRGTSYTSSELSETEGVLMVNLKNINAFGGYKRDAEKRFVGSYKAKGALSDGDLIMGCTDMTKERRLVGHVALIPNLKEPAIFTMDLLKLLPKKLSKNFVYAQCRFGGLSYKISPLANGANVLHLRPENMADIEVLCPDENLVHQFDSIFELMISKINKLEDQIQLAVESRDRLLPKLMNEEIEG